MKSALRKPKSRVLAKSLIFKILFLCTTCRVVTEVGIKNEVDS